jgi:hypothetical protein
VISVMEAEKYIRKGCEAYLTYLMTAEPVQRTEDVPVVSEYVDVFAKEFPGLPPNRKVEFWIELMPGTTPIAKAPYRIAPSEMQELMKKLPRAHGQGFI